MCLNSRKKRRERSSDKYTTSTIKALKTRYIAFKNDTKKQGQNDLAFLLLFQIK